MNDSQVPAIIAIDTSNKAMKENQLKVSHIFIFLCHNKIEMTSEFNFYQNHLFLIPTQPTQQSHTQSEKRKLPHTYAIIYFYYMKINIPFVLGMIISHFHCIPNAHVCIIN